jgi:hypothetical protein
MSKFHKIPEIRFEDQKITSFSGLRFRIALLLQDIQKTAIKDQSSSRPCSPNWNHNNFNGKGNKRTFHGHEHQYQKRPP